MKESILGLNDDLGITIIFSEKCAKKKNKKGIFFR